MRYRTNLAQYRILLLLAAMDTGPKSCIELAELCGMHKSGIPAYLTHMCARIADYGPYQRGRRTPLYDMSPGRDRPEPRGLSVAEHARLFRKRLLDDPGAHMAYNAKRRARRIKPKRDDCNFLF